MRTSDQETIKRIFKESHTIAVVGLSKDPEKDSHRVGAYLQKAGYRVVPVNPTAEEILGEKVYKNLRDIPFPVDVVDIFRPSSEVGPIVDIAIEIGAKAVWMQLGISDIEAEARARAAGLDVVANRCMKIEHSKLQLGKG